MKLKTKLKVVLPPLLSIFRIILIPSIILFGAINKTTILLIFILVGILSDVLDNLLAKKFHTKTEESKILDKISTLIFMLGITISFSIKYNELIIISILDAIIIFFIIFILYKRELIIIPNQKINLINKIIITLFCILNSYNIFNINILTGYSYLTINICIIVLINYIVLFIKSIQKEKITIENNIEHLKIINETENELEKTKEIHNLNEIIEKYEDE